MIPWISGSESAAPESEEETEAQHAMKVQEAKLHDTLLTVSAVQETAARSRRLLNTDLLAIAIERSMRRA